MGKDGNEKNVLHTGKKGMKNASLKEKNIKGDGVAKSDRSLLFIK